MTVHTEQLSVVTINEIEDILNADIKVVSFDIFDTLLVRPIMHRQDVWMLVGKIAGNPHFSDKRYIAEAEARLLLDYPNEDCTLTEIYTAYERIFNCSLEEVRRLIDIETSVELSLVYPRKSVQLVYNEALKLGKEIILTSDKQLPADLLEAALSNNGYRGFLSIYASSEERLKKSTGNLYSRIIGDFRRRGVLPDEILHIGDKRGLDYQNAQKAGMRVALAEGPIDLFNSCTRLKPYSRFGKDDMDNCFMNGILANLIFDDPCRPYDFESRFNGEAKLLGYTIAPILISFLIWAMREAEKDGIEQVAFTAQDSHLLREIYEVLKSYLPRLDVTQLHMPRAARGVHYAKKPNGLFELIKSLAFDEQTSIKDFIKNKMQVTDETEYLGALSVFIRKGYPGPHAPIGQLAGYAHFLCELEPYFRRNAKELIEQHDEYIRGHIDPGKKLGIFDIDYQGGMSHFINTNYRLQSTSYSMLGMLETGANHACSNNALHKVYIMNNTRLSNLIGKNAKSAGQDMLHLFLEDILREPLQRDSMIGQADKGADCTSADIYEDYNVVREVQDGVLEFAQVFADKLGKYIHFLEFDRSAFFSIASGIFLTPNELDAEVIKRVRFDQFEVSLPEDDAYTIWYSNKFPAEEATAPFENLLNLGRESAKKLHVFDLARRFYRFVTGYNSRLGKDEISRVSAIIEDGIISLKSNTFLKRDDNIVVAGNLHHRANKFINMISEAMPDNNWIILSTSRALARKLSLTPCFVPQPLHRGWYPGGFAKTKHTSAFQQKAKADEVLWLAAKRSMHFSPQMALGYSEYLVCEIERYYTEALEHLKPRLIIIWNKNVPASSIIYTVASRLRIPTVLMESGELPNTFAFDTDGHWGQSWVAQEAHQFLSLAVESEDLGRAEELIEFYGKSDSSSATRYTQSQNAQFITSVSRIDTRRPSIFFAGDLDIDTGMFPPGKHTRKYCSPVFSSSFETMLYLAKLAKKNDWNLIYKPHPLSRIDKENSGKIPSNVIYVDEGDVNELIAISDLTVGITTSLLYVSLMLGKPAMLVGYNTLMGKRCAYEAFSLDIIEKTIKTAMAEGYTDSQRLHFKEHVARMNKYYLFNNQLDSAVQHGQGVEQAVRYLHEKMQGEKG